MKMPWEEAAEAAATPKASQPPWEEAAAASKPAAPAGLPPWEEHKQNTAEHIAADPVGYALTDIHDGNIREEAFQHWVKERRKPTTIGSIAGAVGDFAKGAIPTKREDGTWHWPLGTSAAHLAKGGFDTLKNIAVAGQMDNPIGVIGGPILGAAVSAATEDPKRVAAGRTLGAGAQLGLLESGRQLTNLGRNISGAANAVTGGLVGTQESDLTDDELRKRFKEEIAYRYLSGELTKGKYAEEAIGSGSVVQTPEELAKKGAPINPEEVSGVAMTTSPMNLVEIGAITNPIAAKITAPGLSVAGKVAEATGRTVSKGVEKAVKSKAAKFATPLGLGAAGVDIALTGGVHTIPSAAALGAAAGTWAGGKLLQTAGTAAKEAGAEMAGAFPIRGQGFFRKALKEGMKGASAGVPGAAAFSLTGGTPEEAGDTFWSVIGLGAAGGALHGAARSRAIDALAQFGAFAKHGETVDFGDARDTAHRAVVAQMPTDAAAIVNYWRGSFDGATTPDGNPVRVEAVTDAEFQKRTGQSSRGVYFENDGTLLVNSEHLNPDGTTRKLTGAELAAAFAHEGKHALDQAFKATQPKLYQDIYDSLIEQHTDADGKPTRAFQEWIDGQIADLRTNMEQAGNSKADIDATLANYGMEYWLKEAMADIGQGLITGNNAGEFHLPPSVMGKVWQTIREVAARNGVDIGTPKEGALGFQRATEAPGFLEASDAVKLIRQQLYQQGAEARGRLEATEAETAPGTVGARIAELTPIAQRPITASTPLAEREETIKARKEIAQLQEDIGQPAAAQTQPQTPPAIGTTPARDPATVKAKADAMKALNTPPIKGLVPREEQAQRIDEAIKQAEAQGITITAGELVTFATTRDFSEAAKKAAQPPPSPNAGVNIPTGARFNDESGIPYEITGESPDAARIGDIVVDDTGKPFRITKIWPDGSADVAYTTSPLNSRAAKTLKPGTFKRVDVEPATTEAPTNVSQTTPTTSEPVPTSVPAGDAQQPTPTPTTTQAEGSQPSNVPDGEAPTLSVATKPAEQRTPEEAQQSGIDGKTEIDRRGGELGQLLIQALDALASKGYRTGDRGTTLAHAAAIISKINIGEPVSAAAVDAYGIKLPEGWTKNGEVYEKAATLSVIPYGNSGRFVIVDAAGNPINNRTYASEASAQAAMRQMGVRKSFQIPPSANGNDIIDAIIEQGGINLSGLIPEERNNVFPHKGVWRNVLTTDNPDMTPDEVARILESEGHGDGDMRTMFDLITEAIQARKSLAEQTRAEEQRQKSESRRATAAETQRVTDLANAAKAAATAAEKNPRTQAAQERIRNAIIDALLADIGDDPVGLHKTTDEDGKEVIQGEFYPDDPRHQAIAALDGLTQRDAAQIQQMQAQNGKPTHIRYRGAKSEGEGADTGMDTRREEYEKDPAAERTAGTIHHKAVIPLFTYVTKDGRLAQKFITLNNLLHNMASIFEGLPLIGRTNPYGVTALAQEPLIIQDANAYAENHRNGWKGDGSAPMNRFPDSGLPDPTPGYVPKIIPADRFAILNMAFANETSAKLGERTADVQKRQAQLDEAKTPAERKKAENILKNAIRRMRKSEESVDRSRENVPWIDKATGEPNKLRAELKAAGFDVNKRLKNPFENLSPKHILEVSETPIDLQPGDIPSVRPPGFDIDPATLAKEGLPNQKAIGAGFMPAGSAGAKDKTEARALKAWVEKGTDSPFFKKWTGNLPMTTTTDPLPETGAIITAFHGTPDARFNEFHPNTHFTENPTYAARYTHPSASSINAHAKEDVAPGVMKVFIKTDRPFDTRNPKTRQLFEREFLGKFGNGTPLSERSLPDWTDSRDLIDWIEEQDKPFDSVILDEGGTPEGGWRGTAIVPLKPEQIKSATGNQGTFDAGNPDMRFMPSKPEEKTPQQRAQERKTGRIINGAKEQAAIDLDPVFTANFMPQKRTDPSTISREEFLNSETYHQAIADFYKQRGALLQTYTEPYRTLIHGNFDTKEQAAKYLESERTSLDGKKEWENYILANEPEQQKDGKWGIYSTHEKIRRAPTPGASSKTIPFESPIELKPGMWRISPWKGAYGTEIEELVSIDPKKLSPSETMVLSNEEGRGDDSRRYEEWSKEGKTPPPIEVVQTDKGTLKVVDGHRRYFAALRANRPVLAWVSWSMDHPQGSRAYASDGNGPIIRVGLTKEAVDKHGLEKLNVNSEVDYDDSGNIHFMPSKERDRAYLAAAESGDEATAQRLVDEAAKAAGYVFERGESEYSDDYLETADGEAGRGVYAYVPSEKMRSYYTAKGENIVAIKPRGRVIDLTDAKEKKGILAQAKRQGINANEGNYYKQPFAVQAHMMQEHPDAAGYIVPHSGYGIPSGKQVIFKEDMIDHVSADPITRDDTGRIIPLSERFNPATGDIRYMPAKAEEKRPDFYSRLEQNIQGTDMGDTKPQPGWKWAAVIRKLAKGASIPTKRNTMQTGIAAEELKWSGILPWLGEQKTVTKAQVLDYLAKDGALQVQEVKLAEGAHEGTFSEEGEDGRWHVYGEMANEGDVYDTPEEARAKAEEYNSTLPKGPPKFSQYQLPGGENYREVVLTMPTDKMAPGFKVFASENGTYGVEFPDGRRLDGWRTPEGARESQRKQEGSPVFTSTHFPDTGNYIAHARMNERTDAEGKPGLFLEELQSDRGQKIRQEEIADKKAIDEKWVEAITRLKKDGRLRVVCP